MALYRRMHAGVICLPFLVFVTGCESNTASTPRMRGGGSADAAPIASGERTRGDHYDFGWVLPNSELVHHFVIKNDSSAPWIIDSLKSTCGCTVAKPDRKVIGPGDDLEIHVRFRAGKTPRRNTQRVTVRFRSGVPDRVFTVSADVRAPVTVFPQTCRAVLVPGKHQSVSMTIENFSNSDWTGIEFSRHALDENPSWFTIESRPAPVHSESDVKTPRQRWTASIRMNSDGLVPGMYAGTVDIIARGEGGRELRERTTVRLEVRPEVLIVPQSLFIPEAGAGMVIRKPILFRFADEDRVPSRDHITITHDLPFEVRLECPEPKDGAADAMLLFGPLSGKLGTIRGEITIEFGQPIGRKVAVPVVVIDQN